MPLDLRGIVGTGGTTLSVISTLPVNDGAPVAGLPLKGNAAQGTPIMRAWGIQNLIADTNRETQLLSADMYDAKNGEYDVIGSSSALNNSVYTTYVPFKGGFRQLSIRSNTSAGKPIGWMLDDYPGAYGVAKCGFSSGTMTGDHAKVTQVFGGGLTTQVWGNVGFAPTYPLKAGRWAILGAKVNALTDNAVIRFSHADFNGYKPGFPVTDQTNTTAGTANDQPGVFFDYPGLQFAALDMFMGTGCPVFTASSAASGLTIEALDAAADTPNVSVWLQRVG